MKIKSSRARQLSFLPKPKMEFGGSLLIGKRKEKRTLSFSKPMHFVFKSEKARNQFALVRFQKQIIELVNVVIKLADVAQYASWIR